MMTLLVFEVILFGLFGVLLGQFIGQSREAYAIWIREIVYPANQENDAETKRKLCSNMESLSREICNLVELIVIVAVLIGITFFVIFSTVLWTYDLIEDPYESRIAIASTVLASLIIIILPFILIKLNINPINPQISSPIDEKIFDVWHVNNCHKLKPEQYRKKLQPIHLYEILGEKIDKNEITPTNEEIEIIKLLTKNKKNVNHQS